MVTEEHILVSRPADLARFGSRWVLAIGTFDGMHLGHQAVLRELCARSQELSAKSAVLFFDPLPRQVLQPEAPPKLLSSTEEKMRLMRSLGVNALVRMHFDKAFAAASPADFVRQNFLSSQDFHLLGIVCGKEWRFGAGNAGDVELLEQLLEGHNVILCTVNPVMAGETKVSSTRIREAVATGDLCCAAKLLGRPFALEGVVAHGAGLASSELQTPTANLLDDNQQLPPYGVYAAMAQLERDAFTGETLRGIVYVGEAPTFRGAGNGRPLVELHLFDFHENLYGCRIHVIPVRFLRESKCFASKEELARQIQLDIAEAKDALNTIDCYNSFVTIKYD